MKAQNNGEGSLKPLVAYIARTNKQEIAQMLQNEKFEKRIDRKPSAEVAEDVMAFLGKEKKQGKFLSGIKKVLNAHPDKDLILELFGKPLPNQTTKIITNEYSAYNPGASANAYNAYDTTGVESPKTPLINSPIAKISIVVVILVVLIILLLYID